MKIQSASRPGNQGNVLLITIFSLAIVTFILVAYLRLVANQTYATTRSQVWNATLPVVEAGVEDALTHLATHGFTNLACDGWTDAGNYFYVTRTLGDSYYFNVISNFTPGGAGSPLIECRGYVPLPGSLASGPGPMLASLSDSAPGTKYLARGVRLQTRGDTLFSKGLAAKGEIDMNGNNVSSDSFDSTDPAYSTNGRYDSAKRKANGDVATNLTLTNSLSVGNANIYGRISTGPRGTAAIGPNGSVGDLAWHAAGASGIKPGYSTDDMNVDFKDAVLPFSGGDTASGGTVEGTSYTYVLGNGNYLLPSLSMSGQDSLIVTGKACLYVQGNVSMSGQSSIIIATNACLQMYVRGPSASLRGDGVMNQAGYATNFFYYGLTNNTSLDVGGNGTFTGAIYAPNADLSLSGGGSSDEDFTGAAIAKTVTMNGHFNFHYDEALKKFGPFRGFIVTSWNEMSPQEVATTPVSLDFLNP